MKKFFSLALLFLLVISLCASLCACFAYVPDDDSDDSKPPVNPPEDNQDENGEKENTDENEDSAVQGGNSDTDGDNTTSSPSGEGSTATGVGNGGSSSATKPTEPEEKYSQILKNIFENEYYDNLIARAQNDESLYETGYFDPHPYAFLEEQGHDISAIKNNNIECFSKSFVYDDQPNDLYIFTRVKENNSYWQNYLLKYELTDQEMEDYHTLHSEKDYSTLFYREAVFMNDEISRTRDAEILGTSKIDLETYNLLVEDFSRKKFEGLSITEVIITNPNPDDYSLDLLVIPDYLREDSMIFERCAIEFDAIAPIEIENDVLLNPTSHGQFLINEQTTKNANFYFAQQADLSYKCANFENAQ